MKGSKLIKQKGYSKQKDHLIVDEPTYTEPVQNIMMFKCKIAHKKKPFRIHVQQRCVNKNPQFALLPSREEQAILFNNFITKGNSKTEIKLSTFEILRQMQIKCSEQVFCPQSNFHLFKNKASQFYNNAKSQTDSRKTSATPEVTSRLFGKGRGSINLFETNNTLLSTSQQIKEIMNPCSHSRSQTKIRSNSVKKTIATPTNSIAKPVTKLKSFRSADNKKVQDINKPIINYNYLQLKHIKSESFAMIQADTEQVVLINKGKLSLQVASITKIMTAYLILTLSEKRNIDIRTQKVEVQKYVQKTTGTSAQLIEGDIYSILQLLHGLLLPSGNDAALVLADWGGGILNRQEGKQSEYKLNVSMFVQEMTKCGRSLGLKDTRYGNPHGLPHPQGRSTALDQCKLAAICMRNNVFQQIVKTKIYTFQCVNSQNVKRTVSWQNTNKLLRREGFIGLKTGITVTAGPCLVSAYQFKQKTYILTVLRANKVSRRFKDSRKIMHWALSKLYDGKIHSLQQSRLKGLKKNNKQLDSDYSEDEKEFVYGEEDSNEFSRRRNILIDL